MYYHLNITEAVKGPGFHAIKQIQGTDQPVQWCVLTCLLSHDNVLLTRYVTGPLECHTTYRVSLTAWNSEGESPASSSLVTTVCPAPARSEARAPLVLFSLGPALYTKDITLEKNIWSKQTKVAQLHSGMFFLNPRILHTSHIML